MNHFRAQASLIQGVLIFASALVAISGYVIQSRLRRKQDERRRDLERAEHKFQMALARSDRLRENRIKALTSLVEKYLGPLLAHVDGGNLCWSQFNYANFGPWGEGGNAYGSEGEARRPLGFDAKNESAVHLGIAVLLKSYGYSLSNFTRGEDRNIFSLIPKFAVDMVKKSPDSRLAKDYRRMIRRLLRSFWSPAAKMFTTTMNMLDLPDKGEFEKNFPSMKAEFVFSRKHLFLEFINFVAELEEILEIWDEGDFSVVTNRVAQLPLRELVSFFSRQFQIIWCGLRIR